MVRSRPGSESGFGRFWASSSKAWVSNYDSILLKLDSDRFPVGSNVRIVNQTHPHKLNGLKVDLRASDDDFKVLETLRRAGSPQRTSQVVPENEAPFDFGI